MSTSTKRKVLVTGGGGYIGTPTTHALLSRGCDVHLLGRTDPAISGTTFHRGDLLQETGLDTLLEEISADTLIHLAWSVTPGRFWTDPANGRWTAASVRLFHAFTASGGKRIVGVGSCAEYAWTGSPLNECESPIRPSTPYGQAKAEVWAALEMIGRQQGLSVAWARLFFLYGPREPKGKLVADAVTALLAKRRFLTTPGLQKRDFIYVEDAAGALTELALSSVVGPVNVATGEGVAVRDLLRHVEVETCTSGLIDFGARNLSPGDPLELVGDTRRLRDEVGFTCGFSVTESIARTVDWWRERAAMEADA